MPRTISLPTTVLIACVVFLLERGQTDSRTKLNHVSRRRRWLLSNTRGLSFVAVVVVQMKAESTSNDHTTRLVQQPFLSSTALHLNEVSLS